MSGVCDVGSGIRCNNRWAMRMILSETCSASIVCEFAVFVMLHVGMEMISNATCWITYVHSSGWDALNMSTRNLHLILRPPHHSPNALATLAHNHGIVFGSKTYSQLPPEMRAHTSKLPWGSSLRFNCVLCQVSDIILPIIRSPLRSAHWFNDSVLRPNYYMSVTKWLKVYGVDDGFMAAIICWYCYGSM